MYKIICLLFVILLTLIITCGCRLKNDGSTPSNPLMQHHLKLLNSFDEAAYATAYFENIISAIEQKDSDKLKELFSENIQETNYDLEEDIEYLFGFVEGEITYKSEIHGPTTETEVNYGEKHSFISCYFNVSTEQDEYIIFMKICNIDDSDDKNVGLQMLQIIRQEDKDTLFDWGGPKTACKGIYRPDKE